MTFPASDTRALIAAALGEDFGARGDITTDAVFPRGCPVTARLVAREPGVAAGLPSGPLLLEETARRTGAPAAWRADSEDGTRFEAGARLATITGDARTVLAGERVLLNLVARLSGIATLTRRAVDEIAGLDCTVSDTRKTTPGLRSLEKYAVAAGGGENHRGTLDALVLVKDNHKELAGGLGPVLAAIRDAGHDAASIEVEIERLDELDLALAAGCGWVLLDNMAPDEVREAVRRIDGRCRVEVSGGLAPGRLRAYAAAGADRLSLGMLTHGARSLDLSLDIAADAAG